MNTAADAQTVSITPASFDFISPQAVRDPYPAFDELREAAPVFWSDTLRAWVVTRYAEVRAAYRNGALASDRISPVYERRLARSENADHRRVFEVLAKFLVFTDPPVHTRLRKLVEYAFRPRAIARMEGVVQVLIDELVEELGERSSCDFLDDFADPLPVRFIAGMFGVDREHHASMSQWSDDIVGLLFGALDDHERHTRAADGLESFAGLIKELIKRRRVERGEDVLSDLVAAQDAGDTLTDDEIVATCVLLLFAGHETTRNLLANGVKNLQLGSGSWQSVGTDMDIAKGAVEEILRFDGPIKSMWRLTSEDTELAGEHVEKGSRVLLVQSAANRDPRRFDAPSEFNIQRSPNYHVGFGYSAHYCMGAAVARLEGRLALHALSKRFPNLALDTDVFDYQPFIVTRALKSLPVKLNG